MIIECDQCNTKFRLDDSRVKPEGVKVRCTKCQNVFVVTPPQPVEELQPEEVVPQEDTSFKGGEAPEQGAGEQEAPAGVTAGFDFGASAAGGQEEESPAETDDTQSEAPDLSFGGPDFATFTNTPQDDTTAEQAEDREDRGFDAGSSVTDNTPFGGPEGDDEAGQDSGAPDETPFDGASPQAGGISFHERLLLNEDEQEEGPSIGDGAEGFEPQDEEGPEETAGKPSMDFSMASSTVSGGHEEDDQETPYGEFDFSFDDLDRENDLESDEDSSVESREAGAEDVAEEQEDGGEDFRLTPPPAPERESSDENVIPFSVTYNRNGQSNGKGEGPKEKAGEEKPDFADLFSSTLSETAGEPSADTGLDEEAFEEEQPPPPTIPADTARPASVASGKGLLLAVLIFIIGGGVIYFSGVIDTLTRTLAGSSQSVVETVEIENIGGYFADNKNFGKLFVIEAKIKNTSADAQAIKTVTGLIYDGKGKAIATRSVSPGRMVSADDLKNLSKDDLLKQFRDASGGTIPPKGTVPVMVLFTEIPAGMSEYGLNIVRE